MANMKYCPRCGRIISPEFFADCFCGHKMYEVNPKWGITEEKQAEFYKQKDYGEKTREQCVEEWREYCKPFIEEFVMKHPDFDLWSYEHKEEIYQRWEEKSSAKIAKEIEAQKRQPYNPAPSVSCPYCKSTNTKKISAAGRMFSAGLFGFGSKKIGKQWHCNGCGSDF